MTLSISHLQFVHVKCLRDWVSCGTGILEITTWVWCWAPVSTEALRKAPRAHSGTLPMHVYLPCFGLSLWKNSLSLRDPKQFLLFSWMYELMWTKKSVGDACLTHLIMMALHFSHLMFIFVMFSASSYFLHPEFFPSRCFNQPLYFVYVLFITYPLDYCPQCWSVWL